MPLVRSVYGLANSPPTKKNRMRAKPLRIEGSGPSGDEAADRVYDHAGLVHAYFLRHFNRDSYDGNGIPITLHVHAYQGSRNAFFVEDPKGDYITFGDGDGVDYDSTTLDLDLAAHEMVHGYLAYLGAFDYGYDDCGAIHEHLADLFGVLIRQEAEGSTGDWSIGQKYTRRHPAVRDLEQPGFADLSQPCAAHVRERLPYSRNESSALYFNAGILGRAFTLAWTSATPARQIELGVIWYRAIQTLRGRPMLEGFRDAVLSAAVGSPLLENVREGFRGVGLAG